MRIEICDSSSRGKGACLSLFRRSHSEAKIFSRTVTLGKPRVREETKRGNKASRAERDGGTCTTVSLQCYRFICHRRKPHRGSGDYAANELAIFARKPERAWYGRTRDVYVIPLRYHLTDPPHCRLSARLPIIDEDTRRTRST